MWVDLLAAVAAVVVAPFIIRFLCAFLSFHSFVCSFRFSTVWIKICENKEHANMFATVVWSNLKCLFGCTCVCVSVCSFQLTPVSINFIFSCFFASYSLSVECHRMTLTTHFKNDCTRRQHQFISICIFSFVRSSLSHSVYRYFSSHDFRMCLLSVSNCIAIAINMNGKKLQHWAIWKKVKQELKRESEKRIEAWIHFEFLFECACHVHTLGHPPHSFSLYTFLILFLPQWESVFSSLFGFC